VHWPTLLVGVVMLSAVLGFTATDAKATRSDPASWVNMPPPGGVIEKIVLPLKLPPPNPHFAATNFQDAALSQEDWHTVIVERGDNLSAMFTRMGLGRQQLQAVLDLGEAANVLTRRLLPGQALKVRVDENNELQELVYNLAEKSLRIRREQDRLEATDIQRELETRTSFGAGVITSSLFGAGQEAGVSDTVIMEMAEIFGWDIDFAQDLRQGDNFVVLYEERYLEGERIRDGDILAAEFTNQGKTYRAMRFVDDKGVVSYYTPDGLSMRKAFLRNPVEFSRISSGFTLGRYHPILHKMRAHKGVDYAAPTGTPIRAASSGKISFKGVKGGYGNTIVIQHANNKSTLYAHMSKFGRGLRQGSSVTQGQVIGYIGKSGLATGPHLHYEFRVGGVHKNPLTVALPKAEAIPAQDKAAFALEAQKLTVQMELLRSNRLALNQQTESR
jgi:murein DD-endopeptidase MepM/ murein hydrolase activator NlpD